MRCLTLANALSRRGLDICFVSRTLHPGLADAIAEAGHALTALPQDGPAPMPAQGDYGAWLGTTQDHDACATLAALTAPGLVRPTLIVVDHYGLDRPWETRVKTAFPETPLLCIDDLDRPHAGDVLVDSTVGKTEAIYRPLVPETCQCLVGSHYALLRPEFALQRPDTLAARDAAYAAGQPAHHVLVNMGGADAPDATGWVLDGLAPLAQAHDLTLHVLLGAAYPHGGRLEARRAAIGDRLEVHRNVRDMATFLSGMDLAIGAAGSSAWERCCLGLPSVVLVIADNQQDVARGLAGSGAAVDGGVFDAASDPVEWVGTHVVPLLAAPALQRLSASARALVDGQGVTRAIGSALSGTVRSGALCLRPAQESDAALLFEWQRDPRTRRFAVNPEPPTWQEHMGWFMRKLQEQTCSFHIAEVAGVAVGTVRLDPARPGTPSPVNGRASREVSIVTAPEFHSCGVGQRALLQLQKLYPEEIHVARILPGNAASHRLFAKAGYAPYAAELYSWPPVESSQHNWRP